MEIGLVRHFAVKKPFLKGRVFQSEALKWLKEYDGSSDLEITAVALGGTWDVCYSSALPRAIVTAQTIYMGNVTALDGFNEPAAGAIFKKDVRLPFLLWAMLIRFAIMLNHKSQPGRKEILTERIEAALNAVLAKPNQRILIVSHAFVMNIISKLLIKRGYAGPKTGMPAHGLLYWFTSSN